MKIWDALFNEKVRNRIKAQHIMEVGDFEKQLMNFRIDKNDAKLLTRGMIKSGMFDVKRKKNSTYLRVR